MSPLGFHSFFTYDKGPTYIVAVLVEGRRDTMNHFNHCSSFFPVVERPWIRFPLLILLQLVEYVVLSTNLPPSLLLLEVVIYSPVQVDLGPNH